MRWLEYLVGLCLLCASSTPRRAAHDRDRPDDEIAAVNALAKVAVRRHDGTRPVRALGLDAFAPSSADPPREPPRVCVEIVHASPARHGVAARITSRARGPPIG